MELNFNARRVEPVSLSSDRYYAHGSRGTRVGYSCEGGRGARGKGKYHDSETVVMISKREGSHHRR